MRISDWSSDVCSSDLFSIMQTHPRTTDRIERALEQAGATSVADPLVAQDIYYDKIDGMIYGDNADQGYIRGRSFAHPKLRLSFSVPAGFRLYNQSQAVIARDADGKAIIQFDRAPKPYGGAMTDYLTKVWGANVRLRGVEAITVNGLPAATAAVSGSAKDFRLVALRYDPQHVYLSIFVSTHPPTQT